MKDPRDIVRQTLAKLDTVEDYENFLKKELKKRDHPIYRAALSILKKGKKDGKAKELFEKLKMMYTYH